jgi:hypothetical protein
MKLFARVDFPDDDTLWPTLIASARHWAELYCQRRFLLRTMRLLMDFFPGYISLKDVGQKVSSPFVSGSNAVLVGIRYAIALPYPRVRGIVQFSYQDQNGEPQQMLAATDYIQDLESQPARLMPLFGNMWPVARVIANAVLVDYITGYGGNVTVSMGAASNVVSSSYVFNASMVGLALSVPGAGTAGAVFNTTIAAVDDSGHATTADNASTVVTNATAYLGELVPEEIQVAIMRHALWHYENRASAPANKKEFFDSVKGQLANFRDLRL